MSPMGEMYRSLFQFYKVRLELYAKFKSDNRIITKFQFYKVRLERTDRADLTSNEYNFNSIK